MSVILVAGRNPASKMWPDRPVTRIDPRTNRGNQYSATPRAGEWHWVWNLRGTKKIRVFVPHGDE